MATHAFHTTLDSELYFQGLARQEMDFQAAVGELIDNAFSARKPVEFGEGLQTMTVELTLDQIDGDRVVVQVADHGIGIPLSDITEHVFNPGGQGSHRGQLNEHGFGLKNALALLTGGNSTDFDLYTRSEDDPTLADQPDRFLHVTGPLSTDMAVRDDAERDEFAADLAHLGPAPTGTKVRAVVRWKYFRTVYKRGNVGLDFLARRLGEHLGVMHRYMLEAGNRIILRYRTAGSNWVEKEVPPIGVPFEGEHTTQRRTLEVNGVAHEFEYRRGTLDYSVKDNEAEQERGWPYPLRSYYQGSNARCGIDIVVRGRVIKSGVFEEIWPDIPKTVDFNRFIGELRVGADFRTTNNKTGLDPHADNWEQLLSELSQDSEFQPERTTRSQSESSLRENLRLVLSGAFPGATVQTDRSVWGGAVDIDIFVDAGPDNIRCYELKVTPGRVVDLYQLLAGWDGLVREGISPTTAILVAPQFSQSLQQAVDATNERTDNAGHNYSVELKRIDELLPPL